MSAPKSSLPPIALVVRPSMSDTLGDCPWCRHRESSYDDWESLGYRVETYQRVWRCRTCEGLVSCDPPQVSA